MLWAANVDGKEAADGRGMAWAATCAQRRVFLYPVVADGFEFLSTGVSSKFFVIKVFFSTKSILRTNVPKSAAIWAVPG